MASSGNISIRAAHEQDVPTILGFIRELANYEKLSHEVVATESMLRRHLFETRPVAEVLIAEWDAKAVGFALFFHNFSTFLGRPGIYLEDLYIQPHARGRGIGKAMLVRIGKLAVERGCGRVEWSVLDWNEPSIQFYRKLGAVPMSDWTVFRVTGDALTRLAGIEA